MFFKDKKVVVTGGSGFVGSHYLLELLDKGAIVRTHTHQRPLQISDDRIEVLENIDLEKKEVIVFLPLAPYQKVINFKKSNLKIKYFLIELKKDDFL